MEDGKSFQNKFWCNMTDQLPAVQEEEEEEEKLKKCSI